MKKTKVTSDEILDLIDYALSKAKPNIKHKRTPQELMVTVNRTKFIVKVTRKIKDKNPLEVK